MRWCDSQFLGSISGIFGSAEDDVGLDNRGNEGNRHLLLVRTSCVRKFSSDGIHERSFRSARVQPSAVLLGSPIKPSSVHTFAWPKPRQFFAELNAPRHRPLSSHEQVQVLASSALLRRRAFFMPRFCIYENSYRSACGQPSVLLLKHTRKASLGHTSACSTARRFISSPLPGIVHSTRLGRSTSIGFQLKSNGTVCQSDAMWLSSLVHG